jgi:caa(3)-type oxidase subunit IV
MMNVSDRHTPSAAPGGHVASPLALIGVFAGLSALTVIALVVSCIDMGSIVNLWLGLDIAAVQAVLLALYFMRLRWDNLFQGVIFIAALFFAALFIGITVLDSKEYHPGLSRPSLVSPHP